MQKIATQFAGVQREVDPDDPFVFPVGDEEFVVRDIITVLDVRRVHADAGLDQVFEVFRSRVVGEADYERFEQALVAAKLTFSDLRELFNEIMEAQAGRPTQKSSASASGRATTSPSSSERATKLASLGLGEADEPTGSAV